MIRILTIEREYGSGASSIAGSLASTLGWKIWDEAFTARLAQKLRCAPELVHKHEERCDSMFYRLIKIFMRGSFEPSTDAAGMELLDADHLVVLFENVIHEIAAEGNAIIMGRGAPWFLRGREDVFSVFLYAPWEEKLRRLLAAGMKRSEAEQMLESVDRERVAFVRKYYGKEWPDRYLYDMMLNTKVGDGAIASAVLRQMESRNGASQTKIA